MPRRPEPFTVIVVGTKPCKVGINGAWVVIAPGEAVEGDQVVIDPPVRIVSRNGPEVVLTLDEG